MMSPVRIADKQIIQIVKKDFVFDVEFYDHKGYVCGVVSFPNT